MLAKNLPLVQQQELLHTILKKNTLLYHVLEQCQTLDLPPYYVGAGCVVQTVWNMQNGNPLLLGIDDIDLVYFDEDLSQEKEHAIIELVQEQLMDYPLRIDVKNQARVHLWYHEHFGFPIAPYASLEAAINTWPTTASAVGVRLNGSQLEVYAPYGLNDLFGQIVRPNKRLITQKIYENKVRKWTAVWPTLTVLPW